MTPNFRDTSALRRLLLRPAGSRLLVSLYRTVSCYKQNVLQNISSFVLICKTLFTGDEDKRGTKRKKDRFK